MAAVFEPDSRIKEVHIEGLVSYFCTEFGSIVSIRLSACSPVRFCCISCFCACFFSGSLLYVCMSVCILFFIRQ